jgi:isopenicillin N synthase-like dioxygenase
MNEIPVVDFGAFLRGGEADKKRVAKKIDDAFCSVGFVYLKNHSVGKELVEECFSWAKNFFDLPHETKMLAPHPPGGSHHRGYSAPGVEKVSQGVYDANELSKLRQVSSLHHHLHRFSKWDTDKVETPDYKESFESGNVDDEAQPNIWLPEDKLPGFRAFMEKYFTECATLIHNILNALSIALNIPNSDLSHTHSESLFQLRLLHYPFIGVEQLRNNGRSRINAHSDFGTLTLLFQDNVGGLELQDPVELSVFRAAEPIEDTVLVNIGDLMARWSNDRWKSSVHRVGLPPALQNTTECFGNEGNDRGLVVPDRYSIPVFATPNMDTVIDALPGCWDEGNPKRYEPVTAWGYVQMRMAALYE